ncbi:MAG: DNA repair protein RadA [Dehalococcoidia bacterium]|nr:DNA repair protein RadA [Dehalococcoidia bacterium]MCB9486020.1 DNA repair protein RadA [Thermoflexaceae bacterium]
MATKNRRTFSCSECSHITPAYAGRCSRCNAWNTIHEVAAAAVQRQPAVGRVQLTSLVDVPSDDVDRWPSGIGELDRVLGGGVVPGSVILVGGEPGVGKSTLTLQLAAAVGAQGARAGYVCGEESPRQVRMRASRLGLAEAPVLLLSGGSLDESLAAAEGQLDLLIVDSVQAVDVEGLDTRTGGPAQVAEAGARVVQFAKSTGVSVVLTGHVTKSGEIAGPRLLEHLVDVVLYFEGDRDGMFRILRAVKNRFGAADEVGVFEMTAQGLRSVENPGMAFIEADSRGASGCAATAVLEGSRALAVEVQALTVQSFLASPRRVASGIESARLHLLLAVLARRGGVNAAGLDVVATVAGGLRVRDPAADLAVLFALASAVRDKPLPADTAFLGEIALSGTIRSVPASTRRLAELGRAGFRRCVGPQAMEAPAGIEVVGVRTVRDALASVFGTGS